MAKLNTVRKGDKAEYITQGIFSALGYSLQVLRQEDYGIDFLCTLTEKNASVSYPSKSYSVQLKTSLDNIVYDIKDRMKVKWLFENNLPFFICYFDTNDNRVDFYSTSMLSHYLITKPSNVTKLSFQMDTGFERNSVFLQNHKPSNKIFKVILGKPFLSISILDLAIDTTIEQRKKILDKVLKREYENIVYKNLGLPFMRWLHEYETNKDDILFGWSHFSDKDIIESSKLLNNIGHILISLCFTYKIENNIDDFNKLKEFVLRLPFDNEFKSSLINLGFRDESGNEK